MVAREKEKGKMKKIQAVITVVESCLVVVLITLVVMMMLQINNLQGTARVINYAGIVRGATQRLVKLELTAKPNEGLVTSLDEILEELKCGYGSHRLVSLHSGEYQEKLEKLMAYWEELKAQIIVLRETQYAPESAETLLEMSEVYFELADDTVSAAEVYSDRIARRIRTIELFSAVDMCLLFVIIVLQTWTAIKISRRNIVLAQKAYIDTHTGLQNKNRCEELLGDKSCIEEPTACIVFDINNLKCTNDTCGHLVGDQLIADFAKAVRSVIRENDFAGRCGGDEFMLVIYRMEESVVQDVLKRLLEEVRRFNKSRKGVPISYAYGWALSTDYENCTMRMLFNEADHCMYLNKQKMKKRLMQDEEEETGSKKKRLTQDEAEAEEKKKRLNQDKEEAEEKRKRLNQDKEEAE